MTTPLRVLFVEDSEDDVLLVLRELSTAGYDVSHQRVQTELALRTALDTPDWDLILSDFSMPLFDGIAAFEIYRAKNPDIPFLFVSGRIGEERAADAMRRGAKDYILKDNLNRLIPAIQRELADAKVRRKEREAAKALIENEQKYRVLVEGSLQGVMIVQKGRIVYANPACARMFGYAARGDMENMVAIEVVHPDDRHEALQTGSDALRTGKAKLFPYYRGLRRDGALLWYEAHSTPMTWEGRRAMQWSLIEISDRVQAEEALKESQRLLKTVFDALPLHLVVKDRQTRYVMVNPAWCEQYRLSPEQVIGKTSLEIPGRPEADRQQTLAQDQEALATGSRTIVFEGSDRSGSGELRHYRSVKAPIRDEAGKIVGLVGATMDLTDLKQAELRLKASEKLLQAVFDTIPHSIAVKDKEGRYLMVNRALCRFYGLSAEAVIGKNSWAFPPRPDSEQQRVLAEDQRVLASPADDCVSMGTFTSSGGEPRSLQSFRRALTDMDGSVTGIVSIHVDVTDLKRSEEQLRAGQRLLETVINTIPHIVVVKDLQGRYMLVNKAWCETYGYTTEQVVGKHTSIISTRPSEENSRFLDGDQFVLSNGGQTHEEERLFPVKGGEHRYFKAIKAPLRDESGDLAGVVGAYVDLTAERHAHSRADIAHARLFDAVECIPGAFFMFDQDQRLLMWNSRVRDLYPELYKTIGVGTSYEEMLRVKAQTHVQDAKGRADAWIAEQMQQLKLGSSEVEFQLTDGRWVHGYNSSTSDDGIVCLRFDVSQVKRQDAELRQSQKMEALGQLTGGVAHDFNNLLQVISAYAGFALEDMDPSDKHFTDLRTVIDASRRAAELTQQLLLFSRKRVMKKAPIDIQEIVSAMTKMLGRVLPEQIRLTVLDDAGHEPVLADRGMVEQVIMNLAVNARDAMPNGGQITLETATVQLESEDCETRPWARPGRYVVTCVGDTGVGMTDEVRNHIFEPFFTTKPTGKGTGLGLSTVFGVVQQHEALIDVETQVGRGTTFSIYWPVAQADKASGPAVVSERARGGSETILLAEDEDWVRGVTTRILERAGYRVLPARDGEEALAIFHEHGVVIDLVLLDMMMPKVSGIECYQQMRAAHPALKAVFCSGWYNEKEESSLAATGTPMVHKPHTPEELLRAVRTALDNRPPTTPATP